MCVCVCGDDGEVMIGGWWNCFTHSENHDLPSVTSLEPGNGGL